jgi:hypothetical protein
MNTTSYDNVLTAAVGDGTLRTGVITSPATGKH